jgi:LysR family transcriptional regulator for bpeEF and oprC
MDQIQSMRVFARVVESGSFTKAAVSLTLPKGTVTKLVQRLEERLRVKLLNRTTRRVTVTPEGAAYYERTSRALVARRIASLELMTVATPDYLKRHGTPVHPRDIEESHTMIAFMSARTGQLFPEIFENGTERVEFMAPRRMMVNEGNAFLAATLAGIGIGQVARFAAQPHIKRGELVEVLPEWKHPPVPLHVVYPPNRHLSAKTRAFVDWAADLFARHPGL